MAAAYQCLLYIVVTLTYSFLIEFLWIASIKFSFKFNMGFVRQMITKIKMATAYQSPLSWSLLLGHILLTLSQMLKVSYCDWSLSIVRLSVVRKNSLKDILVEEPGFKNVKNKRLGMSPF